jgi:hypothetical protein
MLIGWGNRSVQSTTVHSIKFLPHKSHLNYVELNLDVRGEKPANVLLKYKLEKLNV